MSVSTRAFAAVAVAGVCALAPLAPAQAQPGKTGTETTTTVFDHDTATSRSSARMTVASMPAPRRTTTARSLSTSG